MTLCYELRPRDPDRRRDLAAPEGDRQQHPGRRRGGPTAVRVSAGSRRAGGVQEQHRRPVVTGQVDRAAVVVGHAEHGEVVLGGQHHRKPSPSVKT